MEEVRSQQRRVWFLLLQSGLRIIPGQRDPAGILVPVWFSAVSTQEWAAPWTRDANKMKWWRHTHQLLCQLKAPSKIFRFQVSDLKCFEVIMFWSNNIAMSCIHFLPWTSCFSDTFLNSSTFKFQGGIKHSCFVEELARRAIGSRACWVPRQYPCSTQTLLKEPQCCSVL